MPNRLSCTLIAGTLALASAAVAQTPKPPASTVAPVTVQGATPPKTIEKQAWSFVQSYTVGTPKLDKIARWEDPLCVQVVNLAPDQAALVKARIEQVARGVGLKIEKPGCASNIQIVLTTQPQALLNQVAKANEYALGYHWPSELKTLKTVTRPIQAWYKTATQSAKISTDGYAFATLTSASGEPITNPGNLVVPSHAGGVVDAPENATPNSCGGSRLKNCLRSLFRNVLVVIDNQAVEGKDIGALADYLAMVALSEAKSADSCTAFPSILNLMAKASCAGHDAPDGLSSADAAFLTSLYKADPEVTTRLLEQNDISERMAEILIKAAPTDKATKR